MAYVQGTDRRQTTLFCPEDFVAADAAVRVVETFCEQIDYGAFRFRVRFTDGTCRSKYHSSLLLPLYIHGYLNGIHSTRKLEQDCRHNREEI